MEKCVYSNNYLALIKAWCKHTIYVIVSNKHQGQGNILKIEGKAKMKLRNYADKVNLTDKLPVLNHSRCICVHCHFLIVLTVFANCRYPDSFLDTMAFENTYFRVIPVVILFVTCNCHMC